MATPFVVGVAANILANNQQLNEDEILQRLLDFAAYDIDDPIGGTNLPRAQIYCDEYCDNCAYRQMAGRSHRSTLVNLLHRKINRRPDHPQVRGYTTSRTLPVTEK